jgi:hypothetical protein
LGKQGLGFQFGRLVIESINMGFGDLLFFILKLNIFDIKTYLPGIKSHYIVMKFILV